MTTVFYRWSRWKAAGSPMTPRNVLAYGWHASVALTVTMPTPLNARHGRSRAVTDKPFPADVRPHHRFLVRRTKQGTHDVSRRAAGDAEIADPQQLLEIRAARKSRLKFRLCGMRKKPAVRKCPHGMRNSRLMRKPSRRKLLNSLSYARKATCRLTSMRKRMNSSLNCRLTRRKIASRKASQNIEAFGPLLPEFLGGSADRVIV